MSIKNNIDKTEQLANNLKERVDSINQTITSNNGQISNNLSEIPDNINKMLTDNYKKIACGTCEINMKDFVGGRNQPPKIITIPINLNFTPKEIYLAIKDSSDLSYPTIHLKAPINGEIKISRYGNGFVFRVGSVQVDKDNITIKQYFTQGDNGEYISQTGGSGIVTGWIAIE